MTKIRLKSRIGNFLSRVLRKILGLDTFECKIEESIIYHRASLEKIISQTGGLSYLQARNDDLITNLNDKFQNLVGEIDFVKARVDNINNDLGDRLNNLDAHFEKEIQNINNIINKNRSETDITFAKEIKELNSLINKNSEESDVNFQNINSIINKNRSETDVNFAKEISNINNLIKSNRQESDKEFSNNVQKLSGALENLSDEISKIKADLIKNMALVDQKFEINLKDNILQFEALQNTMSQKISQINALIDNRINESSEKLGQFINSEIKNNSTQIKAIENKILDDVSVKHNMLKESMISSSDSISQAFKNVKDDVEKAKEQTMRSADIIADIVRHQPRYIGTNLNATFELRDIGVLSVPTSESGIFNDFYNFGLSNVEPGVRRILLDGIGNVKTAVDIGASIGIHTLAMGAMLRGHGKLYSFEPNPNLHPALNQTCTMNGMANMTILEQMAVADKKDKAIFNIAKHSTLSSLYADNSNQFSEKVEVEITSLDEYFPPKTKIELIKIDAEGAEQKIWNGMQRLLSENKKIKIILEFAPVHIKRGNGNPAILWDDIVKAGFKIEKINEPNGNLTKVTKEEALAVDGLNILLTRS